MSASCQLNFLVLEADVSNDESGISTGYLERELSIDVSDSTTCPSFLAYCSSQSGVAQIVIDNTGDSHLCHHGRRDEQKQRSNRELNVFDFFHLNGFSLVI